MGDDKIHELIEKHAGNVAAIESALNDMWNSKYFFGWIENGPMDIDFAFVCIPFHVFLLSYEFLSNTLLCHTDEPKAATEEWVTTSKSKKVTLISSHSTFPFIPITILTLHDAFILDIYLWITLRTLWLLR